MAYFSSSDLFEPLERLRREMDALFTDWAGPLGIRAPALGAYPPVNVGTTPKQVDVYVFAAGMDPKSLDVSLEQNLLTVAGEREAEPPQEVHVYRRERFGGRFRRVITLPEDIDPDKVHAAYKDGVLRITVERKEELQPRRIEVK